MKKKLVAIMVCGVIAVGLIGCGSSSDTEEQTETTTESDTVAGFSAGEPAVYEVQGTTQGSQVLGEYSVLEIPQAEATKEYLTDWYENYVEPSGHLEDVIIYSDRDDNLGVWTNGGSVEADVYLIQSDAGRYSADGNTATTVYYDYKDGDLVEYFNTADMGAAKGLTPEEALTEYIANGYEYPARWDFVDDLKYEGFTAEEAEATVEAYDYDWGELAAEDLETFINIGENAEEAAESLRDDGFTEEEIQYAMNKLGVE